MATVTQNPVLIVAGKSIPVAQSGSISSGTIACVIYNSTQFTLLVQSAGGTRFLQSLQADSFPCNNAVPVPTVTPITTFTNGVLLGVLTAAFYDTNDGAPAGFPQPLNQYPGGSQLLVAGTVPPATIASAGFTLSFGGPTVTVAIPLGAGSITFRSIPISPNTGPYTYQVVGNNSGTTYASLQTSSVQPLSQTATVSLVGNLVDTALVFQGANGSIGISQLFAVPPSPTPTFPTGNSGLIAGTGGDVLAIAAPPTGLALYLFDADFVNALGAAGAGQIQSPLGSPIGYPSSASTDYPDHIIFRGYRTTDAVYWRSSGADLYILIRYAFGP